MVARARGTQASACKEWAGSRVLQTFLREDYIDIPAAKRLTLRLCQWAHLRWAKQSLSHHLWDVVFARDRTNLINFMKKECQADVRTYGDFVAKWEPFVKKILEQEVTADNRGQLRTFGDFQRRAPEFIRAIDGRSARVQHSPKTP